MNALSCDCCGKDMDEKDRDGSMRVCEECVLDIYAIDEDGLRVCELIVVDFTERKVIYRRIA